jgi:hypothetical protein
MLTIILLAVCVAKDFAVADELGKARKHPDLQFFSLSTIIVATDNFSFRNKLGEGGFGSVYKASTKLDVLKIS